MTIDPPKLVIKAAVGQRIMLACGGAAFGALGATLATHALDHPLQHAVSLVAGVSAFGFFGACALIGLLHLVPGLRVRIVADGQGFWVTGPWFRTRFHAWADIAGHFDVVACRRTRFVAFNTTRPGATSDRLPAGYTCALPSHLTIPPDDLAVALNRRLDVARQGTHAGAGVDAAD